MKLTTRMMKSVASLALAGSLALTGCSAVSQTASDAVSAVSSVAGASVSSASAISYDTHYSEDDVAVDTSSATRIDLSNPTATEGVTVEDGVITITAAGTYVLTGTLEDGQVVVNAGDEDVVTLVLDGASITNSDGSALYVQNANEAVIYTAANSENSIADGSSYSATGTDDPSAALYSTADLTLAGEGTLTVTGNYGDAIASSDGLVIASGTYNVTAADDGIKGKDYVDIISGTIDVDASGDGIKSTNADEDERGWVRLSDGTVTVSAGDDAFKAEKELEINGGSLTVAESVEAIEGQYVSINGGTVDVTSSDDGINAAEATSSTDTSTTSGGMGGDTVADASITVTGGEVTVNSEGDALDSNGTASISGGSLTLNGPSTSGNGSTDVTGDFTITGGTLLAGGAADHMFVSPAESSTQAYVVVSLGTTLSTGDIVTVTDSEGNTVATYEIVKDGVNQLLLSTSDLESGQSYTVSAGGSEIASVTAS